MTLEKTFERKFVTWCKSNDYLCLKLELNVGRGFPDRTVITPHGTFYLEFKTREGRLSEHQVYWINKLRQYGCNVFVVKSFEEAVAAVTQSACQHSA